MIVRVLNDGLGSTDESFLTGESQPEVDGPNRSMLPGGSMSKVVWTQKRMYDMWVVRRFDVQGMRKTKEAKNTAFTTVL